MADGRKLQATPGCHLQKIALAFGCHGNQQAAAGSLGAQPSGSSDFQLLINVKGRLSTVAEFEDIIIKVGSQGEISRLKDVARLELGASTYALKSLLDNKDAVAIPVFQASGSNAIQISDDVRARMAELSQNFPEGLSYDIVYDPTVFVRGSIEAVVKTLFEAILLVVLVVVLFLQTWRASIIPLVAVPVSLIGTFAFMHLFGFSLNALSLFGLVLAIGIVVDDAIVVVENIHRQMEAGATMPQAAIAGVGLWLTWLIFEAGHWFTLHLGAESARIAGDETMLNFDQLRNLGDGARDLIGVSGTLSVVVTWIIAASALGLVFNLLNNLWRLLVGRNVAFRDMPH